MLDKNAENEKRLLSFNFEMTGVNDVLCPERNLSFLTRAFSITHNDDIKILIFVRTC